jgi:hypothetical protein
MYGKKVAVVEVDPYLGGTCVNVGEGPSGYLLSDSLLNLFLELGCVPKKVREVRSIPPTL